jgi:pimeloyl-ACP methyl ester carboxylesterase
MVSCMDFNGHKIHVRIEGEGVPIMFLHGWPTNSRLWDSQVSEFSKQNKVILFDWLGFGKSDKPREHNYTFTAKKELLNSVIKRFTNEKEVINIVAHDVGGPPAILWAYENYDKVNKVVLLNTVLYPFNTWLDQVSHVLFKIPLINDLILSDFWLKGLIAILTQNRSKQLRAQIRDIIEWHSEYSKTLRLKTILNPLEEGEELHELERKFKSLEKKLHLVIAKKDPLCYEHMKEAIRSNPEISFNEIENCGHFISIDRPEELNGILRDQLFEKC